MNLPERAVTNMQYIQKLFMNVQAFMEQDHDLEEVMHFLDSEPPQFRSVAYESASMALAFNEVSGARELQKWKEFYQHASVAHPFHTDIGLGWGLAKAGFHPSAFITGLSLVQQGMVYDGAGYYHALFKGRSTIKKAEWPSGYNKEELEGFDQGLGRRLWYTCMGEVNKLNSLLQPFPAARQPALWRGIGIACGYVGGCDKPTLQQMLQLSASNANHFAEGIGLAGISRNASGSINTGIELACEVVCGKPIALIVEESPLFFIKGTPISSLAID